MVQSRWSRNHHCTARPFARSARMVGRLHRHFGGWKKFILFERNSRFSRTMSSSSLTKKWFREPQRDSRTSRRTLSAKHANGPKSQQRGLVTLITADHKIPNEEGDSRNKHWYAVVVPNLAIQWIYSKPRSSKTWQETTRSWEKFPSSI